MLNFISKDSLILCDPNFSQFKSSEFYLTILSKSVSVEDLYDYLETLFSLVHPLSIIASCHLLK